MGTLTFRYTFHHGTDAAFSYQVDVDEDTISLLPPDRRELPDWTRLQFKQCSNCPLRADEHPHCPVAANIADVAGIFKDHLSYDETVVKVEAPERAYLKKVPLQYGLFSIFGLIMATSDCPHMRFLKPMARFHLPFASATETIVRTVSMFLLRRYFQSREEHHASFDLSGLDQAYADVNLVNVGIVSRLRSTAKGDADTNAVIILHSLATLLSQSLAEDLAEIERLFDA